MKVTASYAEKMYRLFEDALWHFYESFGEDSEKNDYEENLQYLKELLDNNVKEVQVNGRKN